MKFEEWFIKKLMVGRFPTVQWIKEHSYFDILINVSDEPYPLELSVDVPQKIINVPSAATELIEDWRWNRIRFHWFPMSEKKRDMGLNSIYAALVILYHAERCNKNVYMHCHSGVNRSQVVKQAYYFMRKGLHLETDRNEYIKELVAKYSKAPEANNADIEKFLNTVGNDFRSTYVNELVANCSRGYLPPKTEMEKFLNALGKALKTCNSMGGQLCKIKKETISNF